MVVVMKTIFDQSARDELIDRISALDTHNEAKWGKMSINQMLKHCIRWEEVTLGRREVKLSFLSRWFGKMILNGFVKDDSPLKRYLPAVPEIKVTQPVDSNLSSQKEKWISLIKEYPRLSNHTYVVPFFGEVKKEQAGYLAYKHGDHHLRQFDG